MRLEEKVAVITGGASGMGKATALLFAKEGAKVVVSDINEQGGESVVEEIRKKGSDAIFVYADVAEEESVKNMIRKTVERYGTLDVLFNNAGIPSPLIKTTDITVKVWDRMMAVNQRGVFLGCKYAVPVMLKNEGGSIINTASGSGLRGDTLHAHYSVSKGGVVLFTKALAKEVAPHNIRVNCVCPGIIDTPMSLRFTEGGDRPSEKLQEETIQRIPLGRLGTPEEVASVVLFLASEESSYVTGAALPVEGGLLA